MSRIYKKPKTYTHSGNVLARNLKAAQLIQSQDELDLILAKAPSQEIAQAWLETYAPCMKFVPQTWDEIQVRLFAQPETAEKVVD